MVLWIQSAFLPRVSTMDSTDGVTSIASLALLEGNLLVFVFLLFIVLLLPGFVLLISLFLLLFHIVLNMRNIIVFSITSIEFKICLPRFREAVLKEILLFIACEKSSVARNHVNVISDHADPILMVRYALLCWFGVFLVTAPSI